MAHPQLPPNWSKDTEVPHIKVAHHHGATGDGQLEVISDWMPDYGAIGTKTASGGKWSALFPYLANADVVVIPAGVEVTYDAVQSMGFRALVVKGTLKWAKDRNTSLSVGTIQVYPGGSIEIAPNADRRADIRFYGEVSWHKDPEQMSLGLIAHGGRVYIEGAAKTPFLGGEAKAGTLMVELEAEPVGWNKGDLVFLPDNQKGVDVSYWAYAQDSRFLAPQFERRVITGINGRTITLDRVLAYDHVLVANETRKVLFQTLRGNKQRGHMLLGGHVYAQVKNAAFWDMGRTTTDALNSVYRTDDGMLTDSFIHLMTPDGPEQDVPHNQVARYPLHVHHVHEPVLVEGCVVTGSTILDTTTGRGDWINGSPKWGIVLHDSHGMIRNNVVVGAHGAGIVAEGGSETGIVRDNLVVGTGGGAAPGSRGARNFVEVVPALNFFSLTGPAAWGKSSQGVGYWFRSPFVKVHGNKAAGHFKSAAFEIWVHGLSVTIPNVPRRDAAGELIYDLPDDGLAGTAQITANHPLTFEDNEANTISISALNVEYSVAPSPNVIYGFRAVHRGAGACVFLGWTHQIDLNDCVLQGEGQGVGVQTNDDTVGFVLNNTTISGFAVPYRADRRIG